MKEQKNDENVANPEESELKSKTNFEVEKLKFEQEKFYLDEKKFYHSKNIDEQKLKSDRIAKFWSQFSIFTPLLIFVFGFFLNTFSEQNKREQAQKAETNKSKRLFIERQLAEFYYPIQLRLNKDNAFYGTFQKQQHSGNFAIATNIELQFILPNHDEIFKIIDNQFALIRNESEEKNKITALMDTIKAYQRHVAEYKALRAVGDLRPPDEKFPKKFSSMIDDRITDLEKQRDRLLLQKY